jgi:DNA polymerase elongation subunit (family B)
MPDNEKNKTMRSDNNKLIFQTLDWDHFHDDDINGVRKFYIRLFGMTKEQETVYLQVEDFRPYFYFEIRKEWKVAQITNMLDEVKKKVDWQVKEKGVKGDVDGLVKWNIEEKHKFYGFTNYKKFNFVKVTFNDYDSMRLYAKVLSWTYKLPSMSKYPIKLKLYESNILPLLRFMHTRQLEATGWMSIDMDKLGKFDEDDIPTCCTLNYKTNWTNVNKVEDRLIEKFVVCSFDIECKSIDGSFPQAWRDGDKIIQIGLTLSRFGEDECYYKHLLSLNKTSDILGATVESFETEEEVLLAFTKIIRKLNPDIMTGYNIFGFDFNYMMERAKKLKIINKFCRLSRVSNEPSEWIRKELSSAALGNNILTYYKMTGRVIIDLMKVIQRDYKLSSYKLDYAASFFIREKISTIETLDNDQFKIFTKNTNGLYLHQYIVVAYEEGSVENKYNEGEKFQVIELGKDYIIVNGTIKTEEFMGKGFKVFWCQAKDDLPPSKIFSMCDGTPDDRAVIGKYCLMDCALCNKLMAKLQVIANNASMATVCSVPLSYLFLRGQGIKIFSLVSKQCREENHLMCVLKKKQKKKEEDKPTKDNKDKGKKSSCKGEVVGADDIDNEKKWEKHIQKLNFKGAEDHHVDGIDDDDDDGYEGAIVIIPDPQVHYEPIPVLDFASLYPNSMVFRNLSHECFVNDPQYDNLPGYRYHQISYKNNDGTITTCRFAEKLDGSKGIIPRILLSLLSARKKYKKMMEEETDPFKKSILNCLQNAYKVTANSLYGQTGAGTSDVCLKEIAASTTATGREMLLFSKYFVENYFAELINLALEDKEKFMKRAYELYEYYPTKFTVSDRAYDEKEKKTYPITHEVHVCTDEKSKIPDSRFIAGEIDYDIDVPFYDGKKKESKFYSKFENTFKTFGYENVEIYVEKFVKTLKSLLVLDRRLFVDDLHKLILNAKYGFYEKQKVVLESMGFTKDSYMKQFKKSILALDEEKKKEFVAIVDENVNNMGYSSRNEMFEKFHQTINDVLKGYTCTPEIIYGDTDSVFFKMSITDILTGEILKDKTALAMCINFGIWASIMISTMLPPPMQMAYEKVLWPFIIQGKKRYVGNLYEKNPNDFNMKSMGIELKRRDNAPIVKTICAGIIDQILNFHSSEGACKFTKETLHKIITGKYKMDKFIITKTLKGNALTSFKPIDEKGRVGKSERQLDEEKDRDKRSYKDRTTIVHAVLADRMADRDPGNKPMSNDRIPYMFIEVEGDPDLQGDRVENPEYIIENKLKVDYLYYITNQIMKPAIKFLELIVHNPDDIFQEFIIKEQNRKSQMMPIGYYINVDKSEDNFDLVDFDNNFDNIDCLKECSEYRQEKQEIKKKAKSLKTTKNKADQNMFLGNLTDLFNSDNNVGKKELNVIKKPTKKGSKKTENKYISPDQLFDGF